ncbi:chemotaxis protein CheW [bacterium]|nr:chemotaxis protein CheW [bacterium]
MSETTLERQASTLLQLASFRLAEEEYAVDISAVQEIVRMSSITRVPRAPSFVEGVVNLRGKIVPVIDLRRRFGMASAEPTKATRIIIVDVAGKTVGLIVDAVREVLRLDSEAVSATPELVANGIDASFFKGVGQLGDRLIILLDLQRLLSMEEIAALAQTPA